MGARASPAPGSSNESQLAGRSDCSLRQGKTGRFHGGGGEGVGGVRIR